MVRIEHLRPRRIAASVMVALSVAGIALLVATGVHPRSETDGFLVLTLSTFGIITIYRAWQLGARRTGRFYVPTLKPWKRILLVVLLLLSGGFVAYLYFSDHGLLIVAIFFLFAANLVLMLLFDSADEQSV